MTVLRIAFAGSRASGKTTLALHLERSYEFIRASLAAPIKQIVREAPATTRDRTPYLWEWAERLWPRESGPHWLTLQAKFVGRAGLLLATERDTGKLAQQLGSTGRHLDPDVWLRYLLDRLPDGDATVDDVRYANEVEGLRAHGFVLVRLTAPDEVLEERITRRGDDHRDPSHESEHALPEGPYDAEWDTSEPLEITLSRLDKLVERLSRRAG